MESRGVRNNNLGNIRRDSTRWIGLADKQTDKDFCQFKTMMYGVRAFFIICRTYRRKYSIDCVRDFVYRYAPPSENNTIVYCNYLVSNVGLFLNTDEDYIDLAHYLFIFESGYSLSRSFLRHVLDVFKIKIV